MWAFEELAYLYTGDLACHLWTGYILRDLHGNDSQ